MAWILLRLSNYQQVAPLVRTGGSRHTGLAAPPHRNIQLERILRIIYNSGGFLPAVPWRCYCTCFDSSVTGPVGIVVSGSVK